ncbi:hypothetical protein H5410_046717 [Solanum commersonii]|uniref:Uncharacterized protein n=1 Tax=Solanum commersonii TaxID=4109 RepID=A0A9J5XD16_SOLCO|nr:hypothetical protein H5410_046717 [Solanum commersonii]
MLQFDEPQRPTSNFTKSPKIFCKEPICEVSRARRTTRRAALCSLPSPFCLGTQHPQGLITRRYVDCSFSSPTWFFPSGLGTLELLGGLMSHSMTRQVLLAILRLSLPHYFNLFCSFFHVSVLAVFLNPYS